jgi:hypothetical protein
MIEEIPVSEKIQKVKPQDFMPNSRGRDAFVPGWATGTSPARRSLDETSHARLAVHPGASP